MLTTFAGSQQKSLFKSLGLYLNGPLAVILLEKVLAFDRCETRVRQHHLLAELPFKAVYDLFHLYSR